MGSMKVISCPSEIAIDWSQHDKLLGPKEAEARMDAQAVQKRLDAWRDIPIRWKRGIFRVPADATPQQYERIRTLAVKKFLREMMRQGWELRGRIQVWPSRFKAANEMGIILPGQDEYVIRAEFEKLEFKPLRIELDPQTVAPPVD